MTNSILLTLLTFFDWKILGMNATRTIFALTSFERRKLETQTK
jgi:hypothetical protein